MAESHRESSVRLDNVLLTLDATDRLQRQIAEMLKERATLYRWGDLSTEDLEQVTERVSRASANLAAKIMAKLVDDLAERLKSGTEIKP